MFEYVTQVPKVPQRSTASIEAPVPDLYNVDQLHSKEHLHNF